MLITTVQQGTIQKERELRWNQARLATDLVDGMLSDPQAFDALGMVDWDRLKYKIKEGQEVEIDSAAVRNALDVANNSKLSLTDVYIRESFDRLFHHIGKLGRAARSELVLVKDLCNPLSYYAQLLHSRYSEVLEPYMKQLGQSDAIALFGGRQACNKTS